MKEERQSPNGVEVIIDTERGCSPGGERDKQPVGAGQDAEIVSRSS
jgi:hypothetical protein